MAANVSPRLSGIRRYQPLGKLQITGRCPAYAGGNCSPSNRWQTHPHSSGWRKQNTTKVAVMVLQRRDRPSIGGFCQLTTLTEHTVTQRILRRWPVSQ